MAEIVNNDKGFKVIKMTNTESELCKFGFNVDDIHVVLDDHTNAPIIDDIYYVAVLNQALSKKSFDKWIKDATYYPEDDNYQNMYFNHYCKILNLCQTTK